MQIKETKFKLINFSNPNSDALKLTDIVEINTGSRKIKLIKTELDSSFLYRKTSMARKKGKMIWLMDMLLINANRSSNVTRPKTNTTNKNKNTIDDLILNMIINLPFKRLFSTRKNHELPRK